MKLRVAIWAFMGSLVAGCRGLYFANADSPIQPLVYALARLTTPIAAIASSLKFPPGLYWVLLANAVTYVVAGAVVETMRQHYKRARLISN